MENSGNRLIAQPAAYSVLVVEDEADYALIIQKCLKMGKEQTPQIRHAETLKQALRELATTPADIVLLDLNLPDSLGLDTVRALNSAAPNSAIIVITASGGEDIARLMLRGGAQDFLTKDELDARTLSRTVAYALERKRADHELRSSRSQVRRLQLSHDAVLRATPAALASLRSDWTVVWANDSMRQLFDAVGRPGTSLRDLFPSDESFSNYAASARTRAAESLPDRRELQIPLPANQTCICELNLVRLDPDETAAGYLATIVDVTDRAVAEAERESLIRLAQRLSSIVSEDELGQVIAQECARVFHHDAFWFSRYESSDNSLRHFWVEDTAIGATAPVAMPLTRNFDVLPYTPAFASGKPRLLNRTSEPDISDDEQLKPAGHTQRQSMSLMFAPIVWQNDVLGVISVQSYHAHRYNEPDLELLSGFADQCGTAMARIQAQEELQRSEAFYRGIVQDQTEAIIRLTPDLNITFINHSFSRFVCQEAADLVDSNYLRFLKQPDQKRLRLLLSLIRPDNQTMDIEHPLFSNSTEACRLIWTYRGIFDETGKLHQYQAVGSDVTRLRIAESALARSEQRLELIVSQIPAFLYTTDEQLCLTSALGRFAAFASGMQDPTPEDLVGKHIGEVLGTQTDDDGKILEAHVLSLKTGTWTGFLFHTKDRYYQAQVQPLRRSDSGIIGVVGIALDVTDRLRTENEQRRLQDELHASEKLAMIGRAMASIGHCMKNMLTGLNGGMFLVDRCCDPADSVNPMLLQAQDLLRRSSSRISLLLLNMLDVSKDRHANFSPANIPELFDEVIAILRTSALAEGVEIYAQIDPEARVQCLDADRLYRALLNLGLNALDAMAGGGRLALLARLAEPDEIARLFQDIENARGKAEQPLACRAITQLPEYPSTPMLRIDVVDTGNGIPQDVLDQLFQPFFSTKFSRGTGLGLAATLQFVETHQGHILVQSSMGRGTTFTLLLPEQPHPANV